MSTFSTSEHPLMSGEQEVCYLDDEMNACRILRDAQREEDFKPKRAIFLIKPWRLNPSSLAA